MTGEDAKDDMEADLQWRLLKRAAERRSSQTEQSKKGKSSWFTFPLMSCSTIFSGLRSLCMILFSWRYWIPDPGAEVRLNQSQ